MPYQILTNAELAPWIMEMLEAVDCQIHLWNEDGPNDPALLQSADGFFVYGHPAINGAMLDSMPNLRVVANQGVGRRSYQSRRCEGAAVSPLAIRRDSWTAPQPT